MAYAQTERTLEGTRLTDRLSALVEMLRLSMVRRAVYRQTLAELSALSDRELNDLGLHRSCLRSVAEEAAYGA